MVSTLVFASLLFTSIYDEIKFDEVKNARYQVVIKNLKDIRDTQLAHRTVKGVFQDNWDSLVKFVEIDSFIITQRRDSSVLDKEMTKRYGGVKTFKDIVIVDDMVDTAGSLTKAADLMKERGALSVRAICTHALLSGDAYEKLDNSQIEELIVTDSIPPKVSHPKVKVLSCAPLFAEVMKNVHYNQSISSKFIM